MVATPPDEGRVEGARRRSQSDRTARVSAAGASLDPGPEGSGSRNAASRSCSPKALKSCSALIAYNPDWAVTGVAGPRGDCGGRELPADPMFALAL